MSPPHAYRGGGRAVPGTAPPPADHRIPRFQSTTEKLRLVAPHAARLAQLGRRPSTAAEAVVAGFRRTHGAAASGKTALETPALREALSGIPQGTTRWIRDRAMLLPGFAGVFRRSELASLDAEDVELVPEGLRIRLRRSKTDQEGRGRLVGVPLGPPRRDVPGAGRPGLGRGSSDLGRATLPHRRPGRPGPAAALLRPAVARVVPRAVRPSGGDPRRVGAPSLRSGFVTSAAGAGAPVGRPATAPSSGCTPTSAPPSCSREMPLGSWDCEGTVAGCLGGKPRSRTASAISGVRT